MGLARPRISGAGGARLRLRPKPSQSNRLPSCIDTGSPRAARVISTRAAAPTPCKSWLYGSSRSPAPQAQTQGLTLILATSGRFPTINRHAALAEPTVESQKGHAIAQRLRRTVSDEIASRASQVWLVRCRQVPLRRPADTKAPGHKCHASVFARWLAWISHRSMVERRPLRDAHKLASEVSGWQLRANRFTLSGQTFPAQKN